MNSESLKFTQFVKATPLEAYRAFTNSTNLREWLCHVATVNPRPGGRLYLWWQTGYYTCGEYTLTQPKEKVAFTWLGRGEPTPTRVEVTFTPQDGGTLVGLEHSGIGSSEAWSGARGEIEKGWTRGLENLASVMETGEDLRFVLRPMLGILLGELDDERAQKLGVPVKEGMRLDGVVDGMGAQAAGLRSNDVIVSMAGKPIVNYDSLANVLATHRAGEKIEVVFYRGPEKKTVMMELSKRPIPEIPWSAQELAEKASRIQAGILDELDKFVTGVTEAEAAFKPGPEEWNIKENIAHLIHGERGFQSFITELIDGNERHVDDWGDNVNAYIEATVAVYPTLADIVAAHQCACQETIELLSRLPESFIARKGTYWRLAFAALENPFHFASHLSQMQATLDAARAAVKA